MTFHKKSDSKYKPTDLEKKLTVYRPKYKNAKKQNRSEHDLPEICRFCTNAHMLYDSDTMLCDRRGIVACEYKCSKFIYDPLKHIPAHTPILRVDDDDLLPALDDLNDFEDSEEQGDVSPYENTIHTSEEKGSSTISGSIASQTSTEAVDQSSTVYNQNTNKQTDDGISSGVIGKEATNYFSSDMSPLRTGEHEQYETMYNLQSAKQFGEELYNIYQNILNGQTCAVPASLSADGIPDISDALSNVFSPDNAAAIKKSPEEVE